jgi:hypothetical protein
LRGKKTWNYNKLTNRPFGLSLKLNENHEKFNIYNSINNHRAYCSLRNLLRITEPLHLLIMKSNQFSKLEEFNSQEFEIFIGRNWYMAHVSYDVATSGESPSWDYPGDSESEIVNFKIESVEVFNEDLDEWIAINPNEEVKDTILLEVQKYQDL